MPSTRTRFKHAFAENGQHHNGEEDERVSQLNISQPHDDVIDAPAEVTGRQSQRSYRRLPPSPTAAKPTKKEIRAP